MHLCLLWLFVAFSLAVTLNADGAEGPIKTVSATVSDPVNDSTEYREFEVRVDNKPMGIHSLTIKSDGGKHEVEMKTDVKADYIVYAYVFKFRAKEIWRDGQVVFSDIRTEDGGKKREFLFKSDGKTPQVMFNGKAMPSEVSGRMTTAYWMLPGEEHRQKPFSIFDVDTGNTKTASIKIVDETTITCSGRSLVCQHCKIDGPSPAELWFDTDSRLVRQKSVEQGHAMELRLKKIENAKEAK